MGSALSVVACTLLAPDPDRLTREFGVDAAPADGGADAADAPRACVVARAPARPPGDDPPGGWSANLVLSTLALARADAGVGFDLDDSCTCPEEPSCSSSDGVARCDEPGGIDNGLERIFSSVSAAQLLLDPRGLAARLAEGRDNLLLRIENYNGLADDPSVDVYTVRSRGLVAASDAGDARPRFDGTDPFQCAAEDVVLCEDGGIVAAGQPLRAHVTNRVLVVPDARFELALVGFGVRLRGVLTGRLERAADGAGGERRFSLMDGVVSGALYTDDMLQALARAELAGNTTLCESSALLAVKSQLCAGRDVRVEATPVGAPCDAVSAVFTFAASPFVPAGVRPATTTTPCQTSVVLSCE